MAERVKLKNVFTKERAKAFYAEVAKSLDMSEEDIETSKRLSTLPANRTPKKFIKPPKRKRGAHTKDAPVFDPNLHPQQVYELRLLGASDAKVADVLAVSRQTLFTWRIKHPSFAAAWEAGSSGADAAVAKALFNRAIGYEHQVEKVVIDKDTRKVLRAQTVEKFAPDTAAAVFWLTNRMPEAWKSKRTVENTGPDGAGIKSPVINVFPVLSTNSKATVIDYDALDAEDVELNNQAKHLGYEPAEASVSDAD